jgi:hypothetical protein
MRGQGEIAKIECPVLLELDVTGLRPEDAAEIIAGRVKALMGKEKGRVESVEVEVRKHLWNTD